MFFSVKQTEFDYHDWEGWICSSRAAVAFMITHFQETDTWAMTIRCETAHDSGDWIECPDSFPLTEAQARELLALRRTDRASTHKKDSRPFSVLVGGVVALVKDDPTHAEAWALGYNEAIEGGYVSDVGRTHPTDQGWNVAYDEGRTARIAAAGLPDSGAVSRHQPAPVEAPEPPTRRLRVRAKTCRFHFDGQSGIVVLQGTGGEVKTLTLERTTGTGDGLIHLSPEFTIAWDAAALQDKSNRVPTEITADWQETGVLPQDVEFVDAGGAA